MSFCLRWRCNVCAERQQRQQQRDDDRDDDVNLEESNLEEEDLSLPILFGDEPPPLIDIDEEWNQDEDCYCRLITPLQFKVKK